jgi:hypothetical protein
MPEEGASLAQRFRDKLDAGELPRIAPLEMWGDFGKGDPCNGCGEPIHPAQEEHEFKVHHGDVNNCRFHIGCAGLWQAEQRAVDLPSRVGPRVWLERACGWSREPQKGATQPSGAADGPRQPGRRSCV